MVKASQIYDEEGEEDIFNNNNINEDNIEEYKISQRRKESS